MVLFQAGSKIFYFPQGVQAGSASCCITGLLPRGLDRRTAKLIALAYVKVKNEWFYTSTSAFVLLACTGTASSLIRVHILFFILA